MKILLLDIESAPNTAHVWGLWQQNVGIPQLLESGYVLCWAAKWYGEKEMMFESIHKSNAKSMLKKIHALLDNCDVAVHFNGKKFDIPTLNKEFIIHDLTPPAPYKQVDLYQVVKEEFRFPSNRLDYVAQALGLGKKFEHEGHELWIKCMADDPKAWKTMELYNKNDVVLLERVYDKLKPWIKSHPNHNLYGNEGSSVASCPNCGSLALIKRGYYYSAALRYPRYVCKHCGKWSRGALSDIRKGSQKVAGI